MKFSIPDQERLKEVFGYSIRYLERNFKFNEADKDRRLKEKLINLTNKHLEV